MAEEVVTRGDTTKVNWLRRDGLLDFDTVEIADATDRDVERFCIEVGNDTDQFRRARYAEVTCSIDPECRLPENTVNMLQSLLGQVVVRES